MDRKEKVFMIILIVTGIAGLIYSLSLPLMGPAALSPGLFPGFVTSLMIVLGGARLVQLFRPESSGIVSAAGGEGKNSEPEEPGSRNILAIVGMFLGYLLLLNFVHFLASTIIFLGGSMLFLYRKFYWKIPLVSVLTAVGVFYLFRYLLGVRLP